MTAYAVGGSGCAASQAGMSSTIDVDALAEALGAGELLAVVDDVHVEADLVRHLRDEVADVSGAEDVDLWRRFDRLDEHFHLAAADEPGLLGEVVVELVLHGERAALLDGLARLPERLVLVAAAADRADRAPVGVDEHLGADALRRRAGGRHDGDERHSSPLSSASASAAKTSWFTQELYRSGDSCSCGADLYGPRGEP